jgi:hypothetical protein
MSKAGSTGISQRGTSRLGRSTVDKDSPFYVPPALDVLGRMTSRFQQLWLWLGKVESILLAPQISEISITKPIYVCGLARSGSTLLHEVLSSHGSVATHRLKDYPFVSTPYWWRRANSMTRPTQAKERPHRDKMMVTSESPDAIEEMLWMAFFPKCHDPQRDNRLKSRDRNSEFDAYYLNHLRKLLFVENAGRYAAKANYHIARLGYLLRLFPEAKFVIPIRAPATHIASLGRQHDWFSTGHGQSPQSLALMQRSGHFEFGLDRRPINLGDSNRVKEIQDYWSSGKEIQGWSIYWDTVYRYLADLFESQPEIRKASIVVKFEELCRAPTEVLGRVLEHCELADSKAVIEKFAPTIRQPDYYSYSFTTEEQAIIKNETVETARRWGVEN